jgi:hypothetical protein
MEVCHPVAVLPICAGDSRILTQAAAKALGQTDSRVYWCWLADKNNAVLALRQPDATTSTVCRLNEQAGLIVCRELFHEHAL